MIEPEVEAVLVLMRRWFRKGLSEIEDSKTGQCRTLALGETRISEGPLPQADFTVRDVASGEIFVFRFGPKLWGQEFDPVLAAGILQSNVMERFEAAPRMIPDPPAPGVPVVVDMD